MPPSEPTRRGVLLGGLGVIGVAATGGGLIAARGAGPRSGGAPDGIVVESGAFTTPRWPGRQVGWKLARVAEPSATVIALHGMNGHASDWVEGLRIGDHLPGTGLAVVGVDGGASYWHARTRGPYAGSDTGAMVLTDLLPLLAARGLPTRRIGFLGQSMGGFGGLWLAAQLGADRVFGVSTLAAALWTSPDGAIPERFDDAEDFRRHDVFGLTGTLARVPLRLACGDRDRFRKANEAFATAVRATETAFDSGGHDPAWFAAHAAGAVAFLAERARS